MSNQSFLISQAIQSEGYAAVRQIRQLEEQSDQISSGGKAIIVAFVNMNRLVSFIPPDHHNISNISPSLLKVEPSRNG